MRNSGRSSNRKGGKKGTAIARRSSGGTTRTRVIALARRGGSAAAAVAAQEKHTMYAVAAAGALGYAQREDMLSSIPHVDALGVEGTLGAVAWIAGRMMKSKIASHVATGLLCVAVHKLASEPAT